MPSLMYDNIPFPESDMAPVANKALGRFFTAWGQVEVVYGMMFRDLCSMDSDIGGIVFEKIGVREQLDILDEIAELVEDNELRAKMASCLKAVREISVARNKIAHSRWGLIGGEPARFWVGITRMQSRAIAHEESRGVTWRARFIFTVPEIRELTQRCADRRDELIELLWSFHKKQAEPDHEDAFRRWAPPDRRHRALREQ